MLKDLLYIVTGSQAEEQTLSIAAEIATLLDAHFSVLQTVSIPAPMPAPWGYAPDVGMEALTRVLREQGQHAAEKWRELLKKSLAKSEVRVSDSYLDIGRLAALHAHYADVSVVANPGHDDPALAMQRAAFHALLVESGRPVLVIPARARIPTGFHRIMIAWSPCRAATRAVHDAMPLLERAQSVDVVMVEPRANDRGHGELPGGDIGTHLARHGISVKVRSVARNGQRTATALLRTADDADADLLVAGGYGHSRAREWALGGTTRELLTATHLPLFFSH